MRAYLEALPDLPPDGRSLERTRFCLESLQSPDVRYLVGTILGADGVGIARVAAAVLRAAGARTAILGDDLASTALDGRAIDDALLGRAGTLAASAGYQLADAGRDLGELTRREASVILALTAFAEANERVALLLDPAVAPGDPVHAPRPDLVVIGAVDRDGADRAFEVVPDGRPVVAAALPDEVRARVEEHAASKGTPLLLGGRDQRIDERSGRLVLLVRDEPYVTFDPVPGVERSELATGLAVALALGVMGIRMREEWMLDGLAALREEVVVP